MGEGMLRLAWAALDAILAGAAEFCFWAGSVFARWGGACLRASKTAGMRSRP